ncbi:hypothetical protein Bpla01_30390 [Burkholderia plantarii]|nr:hypothetical protein Bpla01_30390 [Burkholderia plantarii]
MAGRQAVQRIGEHGVGVGEGAVEIEQGETKRHGQQRRGCGAEKARDSEQGIKQENRRNRTTRTPVSVPAQGARAEARRIPRPSSSGHAGRASSAVAGVMAGVRGAGEARKGGRR